MKKLTLKLPGPNQTKLTLFREDGWHLTVKKTYDPVAFLKCPQLIGDTWIRIWQCWFSRIAKRWVPGEKPLRAENSLRGRLSEGKVKGSSDAREARSACEGGGTYPPFSLAREFPSPFLSNPCLSGWVEKRTQKKLSPHIATRWLEPGGRRVFPPPFHDCYFLLLNSPIGSFVLVLFFVSHWVWRSHRLFSEEILIKRKMYLCSPLHA